MKEKKYLFLILFFIIILTLWCHPSYAGSQKMNELDYEASLNTDGSMDVIETWNIRVTDTNTLFKTFKLDSSKYAGITNVSVKQLFDNNESISFKQINSEMYHVTKGCFYALKNSSGDFEIAWGVSIDGTNTVKYQIKYTVVDAIKVYNDCSELYWQFLSTDNAIPVNKVNGTITLPEAVDNKDNLRVWAHGPLNGEIKIASNNKVTFEVEDLKTATMLEVRVASKENIFSESTNIVNSNKFDKIIEEETKWADEANAERTKARILVIAINIVMFVIFVWFITRSIKYIKKLKNVKKIKPETIVDYYREIPDEDSTPAGAAFLYYFQSGGLKQNISKVFSASILDLCLKKKLEFDISPNEKEDIKIKLKEDTCIDLPKDEQIVFEQLVKVEKANGGEFTIKQLQQYIKHHSERFIKDLDEIDDIVKEEQIEKKNYDKETEKEKNKYIGLSIIYLIIMIFSISTGALIGIVGIMLGITLLVNAILCKIISSRYSGLTQKGINEKELWKGLKRYMQEFSLLKEREVPELVLWEKYLVYATAFGISERVIKQLKVVYPQLSEGDLVGDYAYFHIMTHTRYDLMAISNLNTAINNAYRSAYSAVHSSNSSGGGFGGGFSGGGGGRRRRRPEWAEDNLSTLGTFIFATYMSILGTHIKLYQVQII